MAFLYDNSKEYAKEILLKTMKLVKDDFPMLIYVINMLEPKEMEGKPRGLSTDGEYLFYSPSRILEDFSKNGYDYIKTQLLHVVLHGLLGHLEMDGKYKDRKLLWTVMDLEVCKILNALWLDNYENKTRVQSEIIYSDRAHRIDDYLEGHRGIAVYYYAKERWNRRQVLIEDGKELISDDHNLWNPQKVMKKQQNAAGGSNQNTSKEEEKRERIRNMWTMARKMLGNESTDGNAILKGLSKGAENREAYGRGSYGMAEMVKAAAENQNSYYDVLMDFLKMQEVNREIPDSIDKMLYQYGLDLYGNVPLIEPLETEEQLKLNAICVALDSSGSCCGTTAEQFLRETYNILRDVARISTKCELYFFVCDDELQQEEYYESLEQVEQETWESVDLYGWGGTSFVPVFKRIQELEEKEDKIIDCLIYLTDSYGEYPEEQPDYPVFFILPEDQVDGNGKLYYDREMPEWIRCVGLGEGNRK